MARSETYTAAQFIQTNFGIESSYEEETMWTRLWKNTRDHLFLVVISLICGYYNCNPSWNNSVIRIKNREALFWVSVGIVQTIPSLALLVFMIPLIGIGSWPAISALFLYSLLPIVRNTYSGLEGIPGHIRESAEVLGISSACKNAAG